MDAIGSSNLTPYQKMQKLGTTGENNEGQNVQDGFVRGSEESSPFDQADALKRLATASGKNDVGKIEGVSLQGVEDFSDLALNGLNSKQITYLGV